jgi:hypothetical protein
MGILSSAPNPPVVRRRNGKAVGIGYNPPFPCFIVSIKKAMPALHFIHAQAFCLPQLAQRCQG